MKARDTDRTLLSGKGQQSTGAAAYTNQRLHMLCHACYCSADAAIIGILASALCQHWALRRAAALSQLRSMQSNTTMSAQGCRMDDARAIAATVANSSQDNPTPLATMVRLHRGAAAKTTVCMNVLRQAPHSTSSARLPCAYSLPQVCCLCIYQPAVSLLSDCSNSTVASALMVWCEPKYSCLHRSQLVHQVLW